MNEQVENQWVCVTGGTGFIAGHVIEELLRSGYNVKATVRNTKDKDPLRHLLHLKENYEEVGGVLELQQADLLEEGSFDDIIKECWGVIHVASPVAIVGVADPQRQLVDPAVKGTLNVLNACRKAKVKKVVITSSVATISNHGKDPENVVLDESCHNTNCSLTWEAYSYSKVKAEEATEAFLESLPEEERFPVATIHPPAVLGPQQSFYVTSSNELVKALMNGDFPLCPPIHWQIVDVRDVARAHVAALESPKAKGRYIVSNPPPGFWTLDLAKILKKEFPVYPLPTSSMPTFILRIVSWFDGRITPELLESAGRKAAGFDGTRIERELDFQYKYKDTPEVTVRDAAQSMIDLHILKKPKKGGVMGYFLTAAIIGGVAVGAYYFYNNYKRA